MYFGTQVLSFLAQLAGLPLRSTVTKIYKQEQEDLGPDLYKAFMHLSLPWYDFWKAHQYNQDPSIAERLQALLTQLQQEVSRDLSFSRQQRVFQGLPAWQQQCAQQLLGALLEHQCKNGYEGSE
jgi:hypothetical protein